MKDKPNYALKSQVIANGYCEIQRKISLSIFKHNQETQAYYENGEIIDLKKPYSFDYANQLLSIYSTNKTMWQEAQKVNDASYHRNIRLKARIKNMLLSGQCLFLTLTFTNDILSKTSEKTRRTYVARFLKTYSNKYVANIDYGKKNEREHYHAVILCDYVSCKNWTYGNLDIQKIILNDTCNVKLAKYINKLSNHAIKETTKRVHLIYGKDL